jgi:ABC-type glutathione transport system ATPase component
MLPDYRNLRNKYPYELSGGMAQRLNLVLALLYKPNLIILDEPTSSVDPPMVNLIMFKLKEYLESRKASVLIITHDLLLALRFGDEISFLSRGCLNEFKDADKFLDDRYDDRIASFLSSSKEMDEY